jgi:hypothetical protein
MAQSEQAAYSRRWKQLRTHIVVGHIARPREVLDWMHVAEGGGYVGPQGLGGIRRETVILYTAALRRCNRICNAALGKII